MNGISITFRSEYSEQMSKFTNNTEWGMVLINSITIYIYNYAIRTKHKISIYDTVFCVNFQEHKSNALTTSVLKRAQKTSKFKQIRLIVTPLAGIDLFIYPTYCMYHNSADNGDSV